MLGHIDQPFGVKNSGSGPVFTSDPVSLEDLWMKEVNPFTVLGFCDLARVAAVSGEESSALVDIKSGWTIRRVACGTKLVVLSLR